MKKIELLAPAGNMESLKAAAAGGCDAVYLGMTNFSARAFAGNFDREAFIEAVHYCHVRNIRVYVTMNTMLYETEIQNAEDTVRFLYEHDVDALLIQDLGLFHLVRNKFPDLEVHCSTQMHVHNTLGVKYMKEEGASRVVLARETPIDVIKEACKEGIEIEVFAYGAICISYSGQCLMSAALKNRSANRGMCAQCCRLKYYPEKGKHFAEGDFLLSPKDLNAIERIPALIEAGVSSLKIEGRMKRPEYVYLVVKTIREAIDAYFAGRNYHVSPERQKHLLLMFNRGFSKGHLFGDDTEHRMSHDRPNHRGIQIGTVLGYKDGFVTVKLSDILHQHDGLRILQEPMDVGLTAVKIEKDGMLFNHGDPGDIVKLSCPDAVRKGSALLKTSDSQLLKEIDAEITNTIRRIPVSMSYMAFAGQSFALTVMDEDGHTAYAESEAMVEEAKNAPMSEEKINKALRKTGELPFAVTNIEGSLGRIFIPISVLNDVRRRALQQLTEQREIVHVRAGEKPYHVVLPTKTPMPHLIIEDHTGRAKAEDAMIVQKEKGLCAVVKERCAEPEKLDHAVLSSVCDLAGEHTHCVAGLTMNIANSYALAYVLSKDGIDGVVFSPECSSEQIEMALQAFQARYEMVPQTYRLVYGKRVLMTVKDSFTARKIDHFYDMHGDRFDVRYENGTAKILEDTPFCSENDDVYGSYIIFDPDEKDMDALIAEAQQELALPVPRKESEYLV